MQRARVMHLRYLGLAVPEYDTEVAFFQDLWGLKKVDHDSGVSFFAAEGSPEQYVLRLRETGEDRRVDLIAFAVAGEQEVDAVATRLAESGAQLISDPGSLQTPGGGYGFRCFDPEGRVLEISSDVRERPFRVLEPHESIPQKLSHVVLNSTDPEGTTRWYTQHLGFKLSGWLDNWFSFLRCTPDFHSLAFVNATHANLHHVSFEMRGHDEYMRGVGRQLQAGVPMYSGLGKHTPADSSFAYFRVPSGFTAEYSIPQEMVLDDEAFPVRTWSMSENPEQWGTARSQNLPEAREGLGQNPGQPDPGRFIAPPV